MSNSPDLHESHGAGAYPAAARSGVPQEWFAVFTRHQNEGAVQKHLAMREVESFFPTYETTHVWRNRQRKTIVLPLFPSYVFVRICRSQRGAVLSSPGVVRIAGNNAGPMAIPDPEVEFLRSERYRNRLKPFHDMVIGERVRVARGTMEGVEGVLIRRENDSLRFVLRVDLIQQSVSVEIPAEDLQPAPAKDRFGVGQTVQCRPSPSRPVRTWTPA